MSLALILAPLLLFLTIVMLLMPVVLRLLRQCHLSEVTEEWLETFSPAVYRPMEVLLAEEDFNFLLRQPGFEAAISKKLRRDRIAIFRQYLRGLIADFNRLHMYARYLISHTPVDRSDVLSRLIWLRMRFSVTVIRLEISLWLSYFGFQPLVVSRVLSCLDEMNGCLWSLAAA